MRTIDKMKLLVIVGTFLNAGQSKEATEVADVGIASPEHELTDEK